MLTKRVIVLVNQLKDLQFSYKLNLLLTKKHKFKPSFKAGDTKYFFVRSQNVGKQVS